jgi:hypothetical protein
MCAGITSKSRVVARQLRCLGLKYDVLLLYRTPQQQQCCNEGIGAAIINFDRGGFIEVLWG